MANDRADKPEQEEPDQSQQNQQDQNNQSSNDKNNAQKNHSKLEEKLKDQLKKQTHLDAKEQLKTLGKKGVKKVLKQATKQAVKAAINSPYGRAAIAIIIAIILLIIIIVAFIVFFAGESQSATDQNLDDEDKLTIEKTGPEKVPNSTDIQYTITVNYPDNVKEIVFTDEMITEKQGQVTIVSGPKGYTASFDATTKRTKVNWKLSDTATKSGEAIPGPINQKFSLVVKPPLTDDIVYNFIPTGVLTPADPANGSANTEYVAPSDNNCGKPEYTRYINKNPTKKNFGDPRCNFDKNTLYKMLQTMDAKNAERWFFQIVPCESSYNPNAFVSQAEIGTPDAGGAWGLFQMGSSSPPGKAPPAPGKNGKYDRGDVNWQMQASNATTYPKDKGFTDLKKYWAGARPNADGTPKECWLKKKL